MSCRAEVLTGSQDDAKVLAVPVQALRYEDNPDKSSKAEKSLASVFVYDGGRAVKRAVTTGTADDSYIAITAGLKEGEQIVVGPGEDAAVPARRREGEHQRRKPIVGREEVA